MALHALTPGCLTEFANEILIGKKFDGLSVEEAITQISKERAAEHAPIPTIED